jgi:hypothetical protein
MKRARGATWGQGVGVYMKILGEWRAKGGLEGLEIVQ